MNNDARPDAAANDGSAADAATKPLLLTVVLAGTFIAARLAHVVEGNFMAAMAGIGVVATTLVLAWWFVAAFVWTPLTRDADQRSAALRDMFAFSYVFTLLAIGILLLPFFALDRGGALPDRGPIRLVRGCVVEAPAASAASAPRWPAGLPRCGGNATQVHALMLTVGGVIGEPVLPTAGPQPPGTASPVSAPASAASAAEPSAEPASGVVPVSPGASAPQGGPPASPAFKVHSGFVVPLFVVVLALFGGAINLMRRVPEIQKRSHEDYTGTEKESPLTPWEVREWVVFQILQLIAAPFIAMVAYYAVDSRELTAAVAVGFLSGFWSEGVLMRIRAILESPEKTKTQAASKPTAQLKVAVRRNGAPLEGATVSIARAVGDKPLLTAKTDATGDAVLTNVSPGTLQVWAKVGASRSEAAQVSLAPGQQSEVRIEVP